MGVSGCGKSTVGTQLAQKLGVEFLDGDDYHPPANKQKMSQGIPLVDADRWPWLANVAHALTQSARQHGCVIGACSALKRSYRDCLVEEAGEPILFMHLSGSKQLILSRISGRHHEYMPASLLDSQFATLEPPGEDENAANISIDQTVEAIVAAAVELFDRDKG